VNTGNKFVVLRKRSFMRFLKILLAILVVLAAVYLLGPNPATPVYSTVLPEIPSGDSALETYIL